MPMHPSPVADTVNPPSPSCRTFMRPPPFENISTIHHAPTARISGNDSAPGSARAEGRRPHALSRGPVKRLSPSGHQPDEPTQTLDGTFLSRTIHLRQEKPWK